MLNLNAEAIERSYVNVDFTQAPMSEGIGMLLHANQTQNGTTCREVNLFPGAEDFKMGRG